MTCPIVTQLYKYDMNKWVYFIKYDMIIKWLCIDQTTCPHTKSTSTSSLLEIIMFRKSNMRAIQTDVVLYE